MVSLVPGSVFGWALTKDRARLESIMAHDDDFNHGYTFSGPPVACAVALKNLERMEQEKLTFAECLKDAQRLGWISSVLLGLTIIVSLLTPAPSKETQEFVEHVRYPSLKGTAKSMIH